MRDGEKGEERETRGGVKTRGRGREREGDRLEGERRKETERGRQ